MTKKQRAARISRIISDLVYLSRDGWKYATARDWQPLERELASLQAQS